MSNIHNSGISILRTINKNFYAQKSLSLSFYRRSQFSTASSDFNCAAKMVRRVVDFLERLDTDMALNIFMRLDDPADLVRASAVSRSWRYFVIKLGLSKQLCFRVFPQLSTTSHRTESHSKETYFLNSSTSSEMDPLERDHIIYASLVKTLSISKACPMDCIAHAVSGSSTDHCRREHIVRTLNPWSQLWYGSASYWSSKEHSDPNVPKTLIYKLSADISIVTEIDIRHFQKYRDQDQPTYFAKYMRFRMGHLKFQNSQLCHPDESKYVWTYTSPTFPIEPETQLQPFKLPEPVLCIGRYLQIELSGIVQKAEHDGRFYTCKCDVRVLGLPLKPAFDVDILQTSENLVLKYYPECAEYLIGRAKVLLAVRNSQ